LIDGWIVSTVTTNTEIDMQKIRWIAFLLSATVLLTAQRSGRPQTMMLQHAFVIDVKASTLEPDMAVVISGSLP